MIPLIAAVIIIVNGQTMNFDQPPVEQAGRVYVPLRSIFQQLGASVVYQNGTINATGNGRTISLQIGSSQAVVNGATQTLDSPPFVTGNRTLVPLRFVATALGANVNWNDNTSTVTINGVGYSGNGNSGNVYGNGYGNRPPPSSADAYLRNRWPYEGASWPGDVIRAQFVQPVRPQTIHVRIDDNDVTVAVTITRDRFEFRPTRPLPPGSHRIRVSGVMVNGTPFSTGWEFHS